MVTMAMIQHVHVHLMAEMLVTKLQMLEVSKAARRAVFITDLCF